MPIMARRKDIHVHRLILARRPPSRTDSPEHRANLAEMRQALGVDVVWMLLAVGVCAGLIYLGYRIEPHHISKDGRRFLCTGQWISADGDNDGRKREVWVSLLGSGQLQVDVKRRLHHDVTMWAIEGKSPAPPPKREVYVLRTTNALGTTDRMTIKVPAKSRAAELLDAMLPSSKL